MSFPDSKALFISLQQLVQCHPDQLSVDGVGDPLQLGLDHVAPELRQLQSFN